MTIPQKLNQDYTPTHNPVGSKNNDNINQSQCNTSLKTNMSGAPNVNSTSQYVAANSDSSQFSKPDDTPPLTTIIDGLKNKTPHGIDKETWETFLGKAQSTLNTSGNKDSQMTAVTNVLKFLSDGDIQLKIPEGISINADGTVKISHQISKLLTIGDYKWDNEDSKNNYLNDVNNLIETFTQLNNAKHNDAITNILDALTLEQNQVKAGKEPIGYQLINTLTQLIQNIATELDHLEKSTDRLTNEDIPSSLEQIASLFQAAFQKLNTAQSNHKELQNNYTQLQEQTEKAITGWMRFKDFFAQIFNLILSDAQQIQSELTQITLQNQELHQKQALAAIALYNFTPENIAIITNKQAKEWFKTLDSEEKNKLIQNEKQQIKQEITHQKEEIEKEIQNKKTQIEENNTQITKLGKQLESLPEVKQANEIQQQIIKTADDKLITNQSELKQEIIQGSDFIHLHEHQTILTLFNIQKTYNNPHNDQCQYLTVQYQNKPVQLFTFKPSQDNNQQNPLHLINKIPHLTNTAANAFINTFCSNEIQEKLQEALKIQESIKKPSGNTKQEKQANKQQSQIQFVFKFLELIAPDEAKTAKEILQCINNLNSQNDLNENTKQSLINNLTNKFNTIIDKIDGTETNDDILTLDNNFFKYSYLTSICTLLADRQFLYQMTNDNFNDPKTVQTVIKHIINDLKTKTKISNDQSNLNEITNALKLNNGKESHLQSTSFHVPIGQYLYFPSLTDYNFCDIIGTRTPINYYRQTIKNSLNELLQKIALQDTHTQQLNKLFYKSEYTQEDINVLEELLLKLLKSDMNSTDDPDNYIDAIDDICSTIEHINYYLQYEQRKLEFQTQTSEAGQLIAQLDEIQKQSIEKSGYTQKIKDLETKNAKLAEEIENAKKELKIIDNALTEDELYEQAVARVIENKKRELTQIAMELGANAQEILINKDEQQRN